MWGIKLKVTNEHKDTQPNKNSDADKSIVIIRGKGGGCEVVKGKRGQIYGDERRFHFGW